MWYNDKLKLVLPFLVMKYDKPHWNKLKSTGMVIFIYIKKGKNPRRPNSENGQKL